MSDLSMDDMNRVAVPFTILPSRRVESGRLLLFAVVAMLALIFVATATDMFSTADAGPPWPVRAFFIAIGAGILFVAGLGLRQALGHRAPPLRVTREHLTLSKRRIPW